jgi:hypothetical protein
LYLDYEMSEDDVSDRLIALGYGPGDDLTYLHYVLPPLLPPLNTHNGREQVRRLAHLCQAEAVIIDTMGRAVEGEENSADPYRDYARLTGMILKGDGISVLRTDHAGKSKDRGQRGSSAKNDDVDVVLEIIKRSNAWEIKRLHTRITWVPENTVIEMVTYSDDRVDIRVASGSIPLWDDGTPELGREMLALGVDRTWNAEAANRAYKTAYGAGVKRSRYQSAMRWIKAQPLEFIDGSGTAPNDPTPEPDRVPTPPSYPLTGDGTVRVPGGTPPPAPGGYRAPPASGGREPVPSPTSEEEEPNLF